MLEKAVLDNVDLPILAVHRSGTIRYSNPAAGYRWHIPPGKPGDLTVERIFGPESPVCIHLRRAMDEESSFTLEPFRLEQGEAEPPLMMRVQIDPVPIAGQPPEIAVAVFFDLTQREQLENRTAENRLMDSIALMVKGLAHELQNPLGGVKGATQLLARRLADSPDLREYPEVILRELERLERLIKNLLLQGGEQPLNKSRLNVHELLDTVIWFQQNSATPAKFSRDYDPSLPDLVADRDKLHQVLLNLIQNAVEAADGRAPVIVRTKMLGPWQERGALPSQEGNFFQIEIEDQGAGVAPEDLEHLFTPFFTTKKKGNGLGLSISYRIVQAHQGRLHYRRAAGGGSIFSVSLPLVEG